MRSYRNMREDTYFPRKAEGSNFVLGIDKPQVVPHAREERLANMVPERFVIMSLNHVEGVTKPGEVATKLGNIFEKRTRTAIKRVTATIAINCLENSHGQAARVIRKFPRRHDTGRPVAKTHICIGPGRVSPYDLVYLGQHKTTQHDLQAVRCLREYR